MQNDSKQERHLLLPAHRAKEVLRRCCCCRCRGQRFVLAALSCLGLAIIFSIRGSIGVATTYFRGLNDTASKALGNDSAALAASAAHWTPAMIGAVESSFFWGYLVTQVPGGVIANRFAATSVFGLTAFGSSVLTIVLPSAMKLNVGFAIFVRVLQGMVEGATYPACFAIWRQWAPPLERSILSVIAFSGSYLGAFSGLLLTGVLSEHFGWPAPFYAYGTTGIAWFAAWLLLTADKPSNHPCITEEESAHIEETIGENMDVDLTDGSVPWLKFFTSLPFWSVVLSDFSDNWAFILMIVEPTKFFGDVFKYNREKSGYASALPHLLMAFIAPMGGWVADTMRSRRWLSTTTVRKIFNSLGLLLEAVFLLATGFAPNATVAIICLTAAVSSSPLAQSGYAVNLLDIAPRYAGILMGISNGVATIGCGLVSLLTAFMVSDHSSQSWSHVFLLAALLQAFSAAFFLIFASGEKQAWAHDPRDGQDRDEWLSATEE